jgi:hypothetical protein
MCKLYSEYFLYVDYLTKHVDPLLGKTVKKELYNSRC